MSKQTSPNDSSSSSTSLPSPGDFNTPMAPIDIEKKMNQLENPTKPPITIYEQGHWDKLKNGLDPEDQAIVDRLRKLKEDNIQKIIPSTTEDIRRRLALLKDQNPDYIPPTNIYQVDSRTDEQKAEDLMRQYMEQLALSSTPSTSTSDIEQRLNSLKGIDATKSTNIPEDIDEEEVTKNIIKKALAEAELEKKFQDDDSLEEMEIEPSEIYSDDEVECATCDKKIDLVKCTGCPHDLYCRSCFEENHDDFEMKKHKAIPLTSRH
ncbi:abscission/NoCut checkpoint regulator isoform X2 [Aphidius gifuensis]|nr:abscission/NoCut checkpoint regulator isoform X2 [Aphidius gifuensis]